MEEEKKKAGEVVQFPTKTDPANPPKMVLNHHVVEVTGYFKNDDTEPATQEMTIKVPSSLKYEEFESHVVLQTWDAISKFGGVTIRKDNRNFFYPLQSFSYLECEVGKTVTGTSTIDPTQGVNDGKAH